MKDTRNILPPRLADRLFRWYCQNELAESIQGDMHERFADHVMHKGLWKARLLYWLSIIQFINKYTLKRTHSNDSASLNSFAMIKNYLLVALRGLKKNSTYASINIFGLAIGLSCCFMIFSFVKRELNFDQFHKKSERLFRVTNSFEKPNSTNHWARTPPALAPAIRANFSGVEKTTRLRHTDELLYTVGDRSFYQGNGFFADSLFLEMFDFPLKSGNWDTALDNPGNIVLTESTAIKFFGREDPMGKLIIMENETVLKVAGILAPIPVDSHITFDLLISFPTYVVPDGYLADLNSWGWAGFWTYIQLSQETNSEEFKTQITKLYKEHYKTGSDIKISVELQALGDIYLGSSRYTNIGESVRVGNRNSVIGLSVVALLILLIASCNFMNLSMAMSMRRGKEIGIRKVLGAVKTKITKQFLIESILVSLISFGLALFIVFACQYYFNELFDLDLRNSLLDYFMSIPLFILITVAIGILAGLYPAFILSAFNPIFALKGKLHASGSGAWLRKGLLVFQFVIALGLIITSVIVVSQMDFIRSKSLGFDHSSIVKLRMSADAGHYEALRNKLLSNPRVINLTKASHSFDGSASSGPAWLKGKTDKDSHQVSYYQTEQDFLDVTGVRLTEGRFFSRDFPNDSATALVLNQSAVAKLGLKNPLGQKINFHNRERTVIGVVEDFHFSSLHSSIGPIGIVMPFVNLEQLLIKVQGNDFRQTLLSLESDWREVSGVLPFEASFLEDGIQAMYEREEKLTSLITSSSSLAVALACLGLYTLVAFSIETRLKEIGIRKVLGAQLSKLVILLAKHYMILILIANLIAWPITYFFANQWLDNFAYRISLDPMVFIGSGFVLFLISVATIGYQLVRAALINPIKFLRSE